MNPETKQLYPVNGATVETMRMELWSRVYSQMIKSAAESIATAIIRADEAVKEFDKVWKGM